MPRSRSHVSLWEPEACKPEACLFTPHPNLSDEINENICRSQIEGGVFLKDLPVGAVLEVETKNRRYRLENCGRGLALLSGHPKHCPQPVLVKVHGSTWGKAMIKMQFIGRGMHLEYRHPWWGVIRTSQIREVCPVAETPSRQQSC